MCFLKKKVVECKQELCFDLIVLCCDFFFFFRADDVSSVLHHQKYVNSVDDFAANFTVKRFQKRLLFLDMEIGARGFHCVR